MNLKIISPEKVIFEGEITELIAPTVSGEIAVLKEHADLLTQLSEGEITVKSKGKDDHIGVTGGFLQIIKGDVTLLADYAVKSEEINAQKAMEAQKRAEEILKRKKEGVNERDFASAQSDMRRAMMELKIANKRRHGSGRPQ